MVTAAGPISLAQQNLRVTLADCATWRTWVGAVDQAQALARIHLIGLPPADDDVYTRVELESDRPYALVWMNPEGGFSTAIDSVGASRNYADSGVLMLTLADDVPREVSKNLADADLRFNNNVGQIIGEMKALSGTSPYLAFDMLAVERGPYRALLDAVSGQGDWIGMDLRLNWRE